MNRRDNFKYAADRQRHDTRNHVMHILHDDGVHRCVEFKNPASFGYRFTLTTWPGHLAISGDCEDFMFSRLYDMFEFFRSETGKLGSISFDYWAEKCRASKNGTHTFSQEAFRDALRSEMRHHIEGRPFKEQRDFVREVRYELWDFDCTDVSEALHAAQSFSTLVLDGYYKKENPFRELYEYNLTEPSFSFLWACHAIEWGIKRYDQFKAGTTQADHDRRVLEGAL